MMLPAMDKNESDIKSNMHSSSDPACQHRVMAQRVDIVSSLVLSGAENIEKSLL